MTVQLSAGDLIRPVFGLNIVTIVLRGSPAVSFENGEWWVFDHREDGTFKYGLLREPIESDVERSGVGEWSDKYRHWATACGVSLPSQWVAT